MTRKKCERKKPDQKKVFINKITIKLFLKDKKLKEVKSEEKSI